MGDYAGQELFLLEGDSLLLRCFSDPDLDFDRKLQRVNLPDDPSLGQLTSEFVQTAFSFCTLFTLWSISCED